jgi:MFS family permease
MSLKHVSRPLFPYFFSHLSGYNSKEAGLLYGSLVACYPFGQTVGNNVFGPLSDRFGRRTLLLISTASLVGCGVWTAFANSIVVLAFARVAAGLW